ncbi:MAG: NAD-glutamate dehydrogenase [Acidisphaera sp.]|nr:NAD-glutamate dehydrogenase [Acidisphaera sp.]
MPPSDEQRKRDIVERAAALAGEADFVRTFYRNVAAADVLGRGAEELRAAALSVWEFSGERRPGRPKLRMLWPREHEFLAGRAAVQIVNDDMPFLVDSVTGALNGLGLTVHLVIHPVLPARRDAAGGRLALDDAHVADFSESLMHLELAGRVDPERQQAILDRLREVLAAVRTVVVDWSTMRSITGRLADRLAGAALPVPASEAAEVAAFLTWLTEDNFTFLGYREYAFSDQGLSIVADAGKGLLRDDAYAVFDGLRNFAMMPAEVQQFLRAPQLMMVSKSNRRSPVHRALPMDTIGIKTFDANGEAAGLKLIVGLFTSASYFQPPHAIPVLRRKVQHCLERSGFAPGSHDGKALQHILDAFPRDELFQIDEPGLFDTARGILHLQQRQRIALFARRDPFERFVTCIVYVPRDRYRPDVRSRMGAILERAFNGTVALDSTQFDEFGLARIHFTLETTPGQVPDAPVADIERQLVAAGRVWSDRLGEALGDGGEERLRRFGEAFPAAYIERSSGGEAIADIAAIERVEAGAPVVAALSRPEHATDAALRLKTFHSGAPLALSDVLPILENLGLRVLNEIPYEVRPAGAAQPVWIQEFELLCTGAAAVDPAAAGPRFEEAFRAAWEGSAENDGFNRLVLLAGLSARQVGVLRIYCKLLRQAGSSFSQAYMEDTAAAHPRVAGLLLELFEASFDPARPATERQAATARIDRDILDALEAVANLDEDRILRSFLLLARQTLRTNYYLRDADGRPKPYLSVKLASQNVDLLPLPRPLVEVYVSSPRMEGCHLRGGRVARGGIRWSDRKEDFRTEILGLMKAQMVKNAVIVPVGSKGGFVVKRPPAGDRETLMAEVVECYRTLMRGLLDITDTIDGETLVPPADVVRRDGDDPYLVVAADKGTATFSDIANGVADDYGFWLGDAFASGGSVGYDHKGMGITARGAWEAVKRHFRELGTDIQTTDFTCVGVGDMSGDVFGNGMLLSRHTKLLAAFNHLHIFIDPEPDPAASWAERQRLFALPRSSWKDYDKKLISPGGGVYERTAKSIALSPQARERFGIEAESMAPAELIRALLRQPVDLLFFGGIGTYVKATHETHADAGDRASDALRIDAPMLRAKVVGEGANLAMTQRGRIEYALHGGRLNTDAIDNSAGVDTSDHEVNIKIGVNAMIASGRLAPEQRASFIASMVDEVAGLVLANNYKQTQALTLAESEQTAGLDRQVRLMRALERAGKLDRAIEFLPDEEVIAERANAKRGLTRPELSVLLAYAKMTLDSALLGTGLPDAPELSVELLAYFPERMRVLSPEDLQAHRLRREIIATCVANDLINRMGAGFVTDMQAKTGREAEATARAYLIVRGVLELPSLWRAVEALDNRIPAAAQARLLKAVAANAEQAIRWFLESGLPLDIAARVGQFRPGIEALAAQLPALLPDPERRVHAERAAGFAREGAPAEIAERIARLYSLTSVMDIVQINEAARGEAPGDIAEVARLYFGAGLAVGLLTLRRQARAVPASTPWQELAADALIDDSYALQRDIVRRVLAADANGAAGDLQAWLGQRAGAAARVQETLAEIGRTAPPDLAMLAVASRQIRTLTA